MKALDRLLDLLPQAAPARYLDEILEHRFEELVRGAVCFPAGHRVFEGHLPGEPLVPGVVIIEALAQLAGVAMVSEGGGRLRGYLGEVVRMRFRRTVGPGERIELEARLTQRFGGAARFEVTASVGETRVADGELVVVRRAV